MDRSRQIIYIYICKIVGELFILQISMVVRKMRIIKGGREK